LCSKTERGRHTSSASARQTNSYPLVNALAAVRLDLTAREWRLPGARTIITPMSSRCPVQRSRSSRRRSPKPTAPAGREKARRGAQRAFCSGLWLSRRTHERWQGRPEIGIMVRIRRRGKVAQSFGQPISEGMLQRGNGASSCEVAKRAEPRGMIQRSPTAPRCVLRGFSELRPEKHPGSSPGQALSMTM
jgi:hypothetical protein